MWSTISDYMPRPLEWICTFLSFFIPYIVYKMNQRLHQKFDPPWKREEKKG